MTNKCYNGNNKQALKKYLNIFRKLCFILVICRNCSKEAYKVNFGTYDWKPHYKF